MCQNHTKIVNSTSKIPDHNHDDIHVHGHKHGNVTHKHLHFHLSTHGQASDGYEKNHQHTHTYSFEIYSYADSPIHRLDARTKTIAFVALILSIVLTPTSEVWRFALFMLAIGILYFISSVPPSFGLKRSLVVLPFVIFAGVFLIFMPNKPHPSAYNLGFAHYNISHGGLYLFFNALIKSWLSVLVAILLYSTTPFPKFIKGLELLRIPRVITMLLSFLYRFIWILNDEVKRMIRARDARAFGNMFSIRNMRIIGQMVGSLFIRSYERAERIYIAMSSRGYSGTINTLDTPALTKHDATFSLLFFALLIIIFVWRF